MGSSGQEEAPGIFWAWVEAASGNMALALTTLVEQVQSWVKGVGVGGVLTLQPAMDTLGTLLVGWMIFVTLILILGTFFYFKFIHNLENESSNDTNSQGNDEGVAGTSGSATQSKAKSARKEEPARKPTIVPEGKGDPVSSPVATGADPDAVKWASNVFTWLYNSAEGGKVVSKIWLDTINENTVKTAIETGILVEVVELMKQTPSPVLTNMVVDCSPTDNVTITCDCDATLYMRIITTRTQGDHTTESEYACAVTPLRGRLNIAAVTAELLAVAKFDGWPEVSLTLEGIRNNATGRDEQQMMDVINEVITSALRNSVLEINFQPNQTFPRFRRARQIPDPIIPVGYDSMVREKQTHPPSVPRKTPKADFVPLHNEKIEAAGESFTALTFSNLTSSEEQLITRNLNKYPSLENAEMEPEEIEEFCKNWQENYVPAADVPPPAEDAVEEPPSPPTTAIISDHPQESEAKNQNFVLMVSSRSKLIDEPRNSFVAHDVPDEEMNGEEEELADIVPQARPRDEPCLRKETGSPLLLATPKQDSFGDADDDEFEDAKLQFDRLEILDKPQISSTLGIGPLHKGSFVSEACCVGVQVGVAAQVPQLDFRIETAAVGGSVACDLPEYDQEASTRLPLPPSLHNQPSTATTPCPESCVDDVTSEPEESSSPSPIRSLSPEPFIPSACGVFQLVDDSNNESGIEEQGQQVVSVDENDSTPSLQPSGIVACTELGKGSVLDRKDSGETVSEDEDQNSCSEPMGQDQNLDSPMADKEKICSLESILSPDNSDGESLDEGSSLPDSQTDSSTVSEKDSHGNEKEESKVGLLAKDEESKLNKICLNEFTESLFKHIEVQDSELSIPEECVDDLPWETTDVYEPDSPPASLPSSERQGSSDGNEELEGPNTPPFTEKVADVDEPESKEYCDAPETENQVNANKIYQICSEENENFNEYYFREQNPSFNQTLENLNMVTGSDSQCRDEKQDIQTEEGELEELEEHSGYICSEETYTHREKEDIQTEGEEPQKIKEDSEERCIEETFISKEKEDIQTEEEELEDIQTEEEELEDIQTEEEELEDIQTEEEELEEHKEDSDERCTESTALNKRSLEPDSTESSHVFLDENSNGVRTDVEIDEDNSEVSSEKEADEDDTMSSTEIEVDDTLVINQTDEEETEIEPEERLFSTDRETDEEEDMMGSTEIELDIKLVSTELKLVENDVVNPEELDFYDSGLGHETEHGEYSLAGADHDEDIKLACAKKEHDDNEINTEIDEDIYMPIIKIEPQDNSTSIETDKDNDTASTKTAHEDYLDSAEKEIEVDSTIGSAETQIESNNMIDNKIEFDKGQNIPSIEITEVEIDKDSTEIFTEIELSKENVDSTKTEDENDGDEANAETVVNMLCTELEADTDSNEVFTEIKPSEDNMGNSKTETNEDSMINAETVMDEDMSQVSSETESDRDSHNVSTEIELDNDGLNTGVEFDKDSSYLVNTHTEVPNKKTSLVSNECDKDTNMINIEFDQDSKITVAETELDEDIAIVNSEVESHDKESDKNTQETEVYKNEDSRETEEVDINWDSGETEADKNRDNQDTKVVRNGDSRETEIIDRNNDSQETEVQVLDGKKENQETETVDRIEDSRKTAIVDRNDSYEIQRKVSTATDLDKVAYLVTHLEGDTKGSAELKMSHTNSNGITPQRYTDSNGGSSESDRAKVTKLECEENRNENMDTEMDEDVNNKITTKTNPYKESRKFNTRQQYLIRRAVDTPSASEQEEEHDHFDLTHRRIRRQKLQVSFLLSDSGEDTAVSMSSLESLNTQLQEAEKSNYYISLRSPNFWDDSTTDANTDDEYIDPRLLPKDPFSPEEEDFAFSGYISHHSAYDSMTDSEVEGITGRLNKEGAGALQSNQEWRKSDIDLIGENETDKDGGQVTPIPTQFQDDGTQSSQDNMEGSVKLTDVEATLTQYNIESASQIGGDQTSHQHTHQPSSMKKEDISPKDTTENSSPDDALKDIGRSFQEHDKDTKMEQHKPECITSVGYHDSGGQNEPTEPTEGGGEGEGETSLTTELEYVAPLTHTHITGALTQPQVKIHAGKRVNEGGAVPGHYQPVPGPTLWTRHLPSYPVYGPYSVTPATHSTTSQPMGIPGLNGKRLLVKIVKAMGVGCEKPVLEAYSVVEMDEPPQKFTTSVVKDTSSPFWDEQFLFDLSGGTLELLFELYDKSNGTFLGLGIVGIEELVATPSQRQIIPLQSRPYENDEVSGSLTVEFLFLDRADLPEHTLRASTSSKSVTPRGDLITTTTTTYIKAPEVQDVLVNGGDSVAAAVIRDIEEKKSVVTNNASKSTMIIHASKKESTKKVIQVQRAPSGEYEEVLLQPDLDGQGYMADDLYNLAMTATTTGTPTITTTGANTVGTSTTTSTSAATTSPPASTIASSTEPTEDEERGRSRGVRRKRDSFFGTLKKRFSRSKVRSKSMDPGARDTSLERDPSVGRSISMERSSNLNRASVPDEAQPGTPSTQDSAEPRLLSVPSAVGGDAGSTRSSLSDASAISGSSTRTYVNEASTLIIETSENGIFKHYLIPLSLQQKSKWRKKGLKLHIFGEHTFIAKHMSSSTLCEVCQKTLGRRFGKQGYICRDCGYKCHKPCHVKTETTCPNSTVNNMDL